MGQFAVENIQNEWKVYVKKPLDREQKDSYLLTITATDGTFSSKARVEVKVLDANDNSPVCEKVSVLPSGRCITRRYLCLCFCRTAVEALSFTCVLCCSCLLLRWRRGGCKGLEKLSRLLGMLSWSQTFFSEILSNVGLLF